MKITETDGRKQFFNHNFMSNGDMNLWQRGFSLFSNPADGVYTMDRFRVVKSGAMNVNIQRSTQAPTLAEAGYLFPFSAQIDVIGASAGAGDYWGLTQFIEGYEIAKANIFGQKLYYSFWAKGAAAAGDLGIQFQNNGNQWFTKSVAIIGDNVWRKYTIEVPTVPVYNGAMWDIANGRGLWVQHVLFAGTTYQAALPTSWQSAPSKLYPTGGATLLDVGQSLFLTGFQLNLAPSLPFALKNKTFDQELAHCQRYYEKSYNIEQQIGGGDGAGKVFLVAGGGGGLEVDETIELLVQKRTTPNVLFHETTGFASGPTVQRSGQRCFSINGTAVGSFSNYEFHWSADAEL